MDVTSDSLLKSNYCVNFPIDQQLDQDLSLSFEFPLEFLLDLKQLDVEEDELIMERRRAIRVEINTVFPNEIVKIILSMSGNFNLKLVCSQFAYALVGCYKPIAKHQVSFVALNNFMLLPNNLQRIHNLIRLGSRKYNGIVKMTGVTVVMPIRFESDMGVVKALYQMGCTVFGVFKQHGGCFRMSEPGDSKMLTGVAQIQGILYDPTDEKATHDVVSTIFIRDNGFNGNQNIDVITDTMDHGIELMSMFSKPDIDSETNGMIFYCGDNFCHQPVTTKNRIGSWRPELLDHFLVKQSAALNGHEALGLWQSNGYLSELSGIHFGCAGYICGSDWPNMTTTITTYTIGNLKNGISTDYTGVDFRNFRNIYRNLHLLRTFLAPCGCDLHPNIHDSQLQLEAGYEHGGMGFLLKTVEEEGYADEQWGDSDFNWDGVDFAD